MYALALTWACAGGRGGAPTLPVPDPAADRTTQSGAVGGFEARYGGHAWLGIPYAKPPVGALRWHAPQPPEAWTGTRPALAFGSPCTQIASPFGGIENVKAGAVAGSEDCLYLNLWSPSFPQGRVPTGGDRLPVMLWIHGGGNSVGHGGFFDGSNLATTQRVIVITFNYQLGPFGWLRHPALQDAGSTDVDRSGNFGTLDLIRALQWVHENVSAFGGDPGNVTIFGESAGGANVVTLLVSPLAKGLFHRAIVQSGGTRTASVEEGEHFLDDPVPGHKSSSNEILLELLVRDGTAADRAAAKARLAHMSSGEIAGYLYGKPAPDILSVYAKESTEGLIDWPHLYRDGVVLPPDDPFQLFGRPGGYNQVPTILGTNRDEMKLFLSFDPKLVRRWFGVIPSLRDAEKYEVVAHYGTEMWKAGSADELAMRMRAVQGPSVYVYRFDWHDEPKILWSDLSVVLGAAHAFEIPFVFGHFDLGRAGNVLFTTANESARKALSANMMSYWAQFAYTGDPAHGRTGELPRWAAWDDRSTTSDKFIIFDTPANGGVRMAHDVLTKAGIVAEIDADPRLPTQRDKCERLHDLAGRSGYFTAEDYATARCAAYPFDKYPWSG